MQQLADVVLVCEDCGSPFHFTAAEQVFYAERGFRQPVRCAECRAQRRAERNRETIAAYEALSTSSHWREVGGTYGGVQQGSQVNRSKSSWSTGGRPTFRTVCAACGRDTEVPFQPRGGRPVYCRECFNQRRGR
ncbi:MAG: CxxC-x17-CxxC domain-containing protein [Thermomicrobiales bacterium]